MESLIFQLIPFVYDQLSGLSGSCVLVVSLLNAIISNKMEKLPSQGIGEKAFKQQREDYTMDNTMNIVCGHAKRSIEEIARGEMLSNSVKAVVIDKVFVFCILFATHYKLHDYNYKKIQKCRK